MADTAKRLEMPVFPEERFIEAVKTDYAAMKNMIYGEYPSFETILECLENLQEEVHQLSQR